MSNYESHHRFARITARKARYVADLVRGQNVNRALETLAFTHKRASFFVSRVLRSAIANATREGNVNANHLFVREIQVDSGPLLQGRLRFMPGPMGRALPIRKRTSHIHIVLGLDEETTGRRRNASKGAQAKESGTESAKARRGPAPGTEPLAEAGTATAEREQTPKSPKPRKTSRKA